MSIVIDVLAVIGGLCVVSTASLFLLVARDTRRVKRTRHIREGRPLSARERRALDQLDPDGDSSGS